MPARSKARKRALDVLYEADLRDLDAVGVLAERLAQADPPVAEYAVTLVEGVVAHREVIDALIGRYAEGWTIDRMPPVDRNLIRLGTYELLWCRDAIPAAVAISEAVELARALSTEESPRFVNGLLARLAEETLDAEAPGLAPLDAELDGPPGLGGQDTPGDELLGESSGGGVVDDGERP